MDPVKSNLCEIVSGNHKITVPMYQRKYEWEKEKINAFWDDLLKLIETNEKKTQHYLGTMVRSDEPPGNGGLANFMVIDGQQRITTVMLLLYAIKEYLKECKFDLIDPAVKTILDQRVLDYQGADGRYRLHIRNLMHDDYFVNKINEKNDKKFVPTEFDHESYFGLMYNGRPLRRFRHFKHANLFKAKISDAGLGIKTHVERALFIHSLFDALYRMNFVYIVLNTLDKPQQIFESINYRGMPLTVTDLIRNHVLRVADEGARVKIFNQVWKPIQEELQRDEENNGPDLFDGFFRAFLAMQNDVVSDDELFASFTRIYPRVDGENEQELINRLKPICQYAAVYRILSSPNDTETETELGRALYHFSRLNFITPMSVLMKFYRCKEPHPSPDFVVKALAVLESYYVRRQVLNKSVKRMAEMFSRICKEYDPAVVKDDDFPKWLNEKIVYLASTDFPHLQPVGDEQLRSKAKGEDVYVNSRTVTKYILVEREILKSKDSTKDIIGCEIEHVLPQNFEENWMKDITSWNLLNGAPQQPDTLKALADYRIHQFGNLTLVSPGGNKSLSNKKFSEKKAEKTFGYNNTTYRTTRDDFSSIDKWTFDQIDERSSSLFEFIINRFSYTPGWNLKIKIK